MNTYEKAYERYCFAYDAIDWPIGPRTNAAKIHEFEEALMELKAEELNFGDHKLRAGHLHEKRHPAQSNEMTP